MKTCFGFLATVLIPSILFPSTDLPQGIAKIKEDFKINEQTQESSQFPVVTSDQLGNFYIVWFESPHIKFRKVDPNGNPTSNVITVTTSNAEPEGKSQDIAVDELGTIMIVWFDGRNTDPLNGALDIFISVYDSNLDVMINNVFIQPSGVRDPFGGPIDDAHVPSKEHLFLIPYKAEDLFGSLYSNFILSYSDEPRGMPIRDQEDVISTLIQVLNDENYPSLEYYDPIHVDDNGTTSIADGHGAIARDVNDELLYVFYEETDPTTSDIYRQRFDLELFYTNQFNPINTNEISIDSGQERQLKWPNIVFQKTPQLTNNFVISALDIWNDDVVCRLFDSSGIGGDLILANTITKRFSQYQQKYMDIFSNDYFVLVWDGTKDLGSPDIYGVAYDSDGNPIGGEFVLNDTLFNQSEINAKTPSVAIGANDRFLVTWADDRDEDGTGGWDIYAALFQLDLVPPVIYGTTEYDPPAKVYDPWANPYPITMVAMDNQNGSGLEGDVLLIQTTYPSILYGGGSVTDTVICEPYVEQDFYRGFLNPPDDPGTYIEYYIWVQDKAQNTRTAPQDLPPGFQLWVSVLGDINVDGCYSNIDLAEMEDIIAGEYAPDPDSFFADINQDALIDQEDLDSLEILIGPYPYIGCIARIPTGPPLELAAASSGPGETNVRVPVYLDNDSSKVSTVYFVFQYDSTVFTIPSLEQTSRSQGIPYSYESQPSKKKVRLLGNDSTYIDPGEGAILKLKVDVASNAPEGSYHFDILRACAADTANQDLLTQPLRGKFFIPEAPPVSIICSPLGDTTLTPADTLTFGTTLTNHSDSTMSPKFFIYGTTTGPDSFTFLAVDTTQIMMLSPGERKHDVTDLEVPAGAPQGHYVFTAYVVSPVTDSTFDDDPFGFQVVGGAGRPGKSQNELLSSTNEMGPWKVLSGWFEYNEREGKEAEDVILSSPLPKVFSISQNFPNPFNPSTTIQFDIPEGQTSAPVDLSIYDLRGRLVRRLVDEQKGPGTYQVHWDGRDEQNRKVSSGVYLYRITAGDFVSTRKMVLLD